MGIAFLWALGAFVAPPSGSPVPPSSRQLVLVLTPNATATEGVLRRFERDSERSPWKPLEAEWPIVVGRTGLASGAGLHRDSVPGLPRKREGDGKSPAGVFALTSAFGFAPAEQSGLPYLQLTEAVECVDDPDSRHYNRLVDRSEVSTPDWKSSEKMREIPGYVVGVVVAHNAEPIAPVAGSCIFLHAWSGPGSPTVGCTAMPEEKVRDLVRWLDAAENPVLVQLTRDAYALLRAPWKLSDSRRDPGPGAPSAEDASP